MQGSLRKNEQEVFLLFFHAVLCWDANCEPGHFVPNRWPQVAENRETVDIFKRYIVSATFGQEVSSDSHSLQYVIYGKHATGTPALP